MTAASIALTLERLTLSYDSADPDSHRDLDLAVADLVALREARKALGEWEVVLTDYLSDALGRNALDIEGVGHVEVKRGTDRKQWQRHDLLRAVLDSRRPFDEETGEAQGTDDGTAVVDDEPISCSPDLGRVLDVWLLGAPRVTALRERGIDPDEFAEATAGKVSVIVTPTATR